MPSYIHCGAITFTCASIKVRLGGVGWGGAQKSYLTYACTGAMAWMVHHRRGWGECSNVILHSLGLLRAIDAAAFSSPALLHVLDVLL